MPDFSRQTFADEWSQIPDLDLSAQELVEVIHLTERFLSAESVPDLRIRRKHIEMIVRNLRAWEVPALECIAEDALTPHQLISSREDFSKLGIIPSPDYQAAWERKIIRALDTGHLGSKDTALCLYLYAHAAQKPSLAFWAAWRKNAVNLVRKGDFTNYTDIITVLHSCAILNACGENQFAPRTAKTFHAEMPKGALNNPYLIHRAEQACDWFGLPFDQTAARSFDSSSRLEDDIRKIFHDAGYPYVPRELDGLDHRVDQTFGGDNKNTMLEIDGPTHLLTALDPQTGRWSRHYDGETIFRSAQITRAEEKAVLFRLPLRLAEHARKISVACQRSFAAETIALGHGVPPGVYVIECNGIGRGEIITAKPLTPGAEIA